MALRARKAWTVRNAVESQRGPPRMRSGISWNSQFRQKKLACRVDGS